MITHVRLRHEAGLWCLYASGLPRCFLTQAEWDHPARDYLCGLLTEQRAREKAAAEGWEVVE